MVFSSSEIPSLPCFLATKCFGRAWRGVPDMHLAYLPKFNMVHVKNKHPGIGDSGFGNHHLFFFQPVNLESISLAITTMWPWHPIPTDPTNVGQTTLTLGSSAGRHSLGSRDPMDSHRGVRVRDLQLGHDRVLLTGFCFFGPQGVFMKLQKTFKESGRGGVLLLMAEILHQLIGNLSHYVQGFIHPRWCRISAINSSND